MIVFNSLFKDLFILVTSCQTLRLCDLVVARGRNGTGEVHAQFFTKEQAVKKR
jgi:hypothetical protein